MVGFVLELVGVFPLNFLNPNLSHTRLLRRHPLPPRGLWVVTLTNSTKPHPSMRLRIDTLSRWRGPQYGEAFPDWEGYIGELSC
jgi:hypothetical protein